MEVALENLTKRVDNIEYKEVKPLKEEVNELKTDLKLNAQMVSRNIETNNQLNITMRSLEKTMILMEQSMSQSSNKVNDIDDKLDRMNEKFEEKFQDVGTKIQEVDNKYMLDVGTAMTNSVKSNIEKIITLILAGGGLAYIYHLLSIK